MPPEPELVEIELQGGVRTKLPKSDAEAYQAARTKDKGERETLAQRVGAIEAERREALAAKIDAERKAEIEKASKAGDIEKVRELATQGHRETLAKLGRATARDRLFAVATTTLPGLDKTMYQDIVGANLDRVRLNPDTLDVEVLDEAGQLAKGTDGKPLGVDALIAGFAKTRPYIQPKKTPAADGDAVGRSDHAGTMPETMTLSEQQALMRRGKAGWTTAHRLAVLAGKLKIIND